MTTVATYEHYKILGVNVGAGFADITASYKKLCRTHHPDVSDDPSSLELMKDINVAYTALRAKFAREAAFRSRHVYSRPVRARRYSNPDFDSFGHVGYSSKSKSEETDAETDVEAERAAYAAIFDYFTAINERDYVKAYKCLSFYDRAHITQDGFVRWRKSVARLYPMREFNITGGLAPAVIKFKNSKSLPARKFNVSVTEENYVDDSTYEGVIEKLVTKEHGVWKVFLGYKSVAELTHRFDEKLDAKKKRDINQRWEEHSTQMCADFDMYNLVGMRKIMKREIYRQRRYGGTFSFAAISLTSGAAKLSGQEELVSSAARTIASSLRQTDVAAYAEDGVFLILFVELRKKCSSEVLLRLVEKIRRKAGVGLGEKAIIEHEIDTWSSGNKADTVAINEMLTKFKKKI